MILDNYVAMNSVRWFFSCHPFFSAPRKVHEDPKADHQQERHLATALQENPR